MKPEKFYSDKLKKYRELEKKLKKRINTLSLFRFISMILLVYFFIKGINTHPLFFIASFVSLLFFILFVRLYKNRSDEKKKTRFLIDINEKEIRALNGDFKDFQKGSEFLNPEHEFTYDLDIFGEKSLFQYVCRCCTLNGEKVLASRFLTSPEKEEIIERNSSIHKELSGKPDFMQDYLTTGMMVVEKDIESSQIISWLNKKTNSIKILAHVLAIILALINISIIVISFFVPGFISYLIISGLSSWFLYGLYFQKINHYHSKIGRKQDIIKKFTVLSRVLAAGSFKHEFLVEASKTASNSIQHTRRLEQLMDLFDTRLNLLMGAVLNTILLLDFQLIIALERWKRKNRSLLLEILEIHSETDAYISGGIYTFNHPDFSYGVPVTQGFNAEKLGHPLILSNCVLNDFRLHQEEKIVVVTGANMAGKSTFLRTIGVNLILAGAGLPVFAEKFEFQVCPLITGMRTTDSLADSESYFFAELKRLKRIVERLRKGENLYILLDEILKGTNSTDKHIGSEALLKQIVNYETKLFIATHDLKLGELEKAFPHRIKNYHFESFIKDGELKFDYRIREGIAKNMNASFLMKKMDILKD
jgi:hypothetical protein